MTNMKRHLHWLAVNASFAALFLAGYHFDIEGARNVFTLLLWVFLLPLQLLLVLWKDAARTLAQEPRERIKSFISRALMLGVLVSLTWQGYTLTALGICLFMLLGSVVRWAVDKERERMSEVAQ